MPRTLSTAGAARVLGLSEAHLRRLVRLGLSRPGRRGRRYAFSFQDLVILRTAHELIQQDVPLARVARSISALAKELPSHRQLSGLRILADGRGVAVSDTDGVWNVETGQGLLAFTVDELSARIDHETARSVAPLGATPEARAHREFERALELEDDDPAEACEAYSRAIELDPELVDAYVNLGCIAHNAGRSKDAARLYELALQRTPDDPVIHFNLGLALEATDGPQAAVSHYERAVELDATFSDALYNLGSVCEELGRSQDAIRHYREYKRLTQ